MQQTLREWSRRSAFLKISFYLIEDFIRGLKLSLGKLGTESGAAHAKFSEEESMIYIENIIHSYKTNGNIEKFSGTVAELGPGDNAGVAMLMRGEGCTQIDLVDRYYSDRNTEQQSKIYQHIADKYDLNHLKTTDSWDEQKIAGINWKIGQAAEDYFRQCADRNEPVYDFIVSCAVLEHLYDPLDCLQQMVGCLKSGGKILQIVDLRDHNMFTPVKHELFFLQIPSFIYPLTGKNSGRPNRILIHRYREVLESMKQAGLIDYSILVGSLADVGKIEPPQKFQDIDPEKQRQTIEFVEQHRHKFAQEFKHVDSQDLAVSGIFIDIIKK